MTNSGFENWMWRVSTDEDGNLLEMINTNKKQYDDYDMEDAYEWGRQAHANAENAKLARENDALRELLSANARVMKANIRKEMEAENIVS